MARSIHINDARKLLDSGQPCNLKLWKLSTGDILEYNNVVCIGSHYRGGTRIVKFPDSEEIRELRDVCMFEIDGLTIFL